MVPDERLARRFHIIRENLARLRQLARLIEGDFVADFRNVESAKHLLQTSIEAVIDVAVHLVAQLKEPLPDHHAEVFAALARHGVIPESRIETYRKMVGFRNRVVHLYDRVDDRRVWELLQSDLPDFEEFISEIVSRPSESPARARSRISARVPGPRGRSRTGPAAVPGAARRSAKRRAPSRPRKVPRRPSTRRRTDSVP